MSEVEDDRPLSALVRQGWEVIHFASNWGNSGMTEQTLLMRRGAEHKLLTIRKKLMGSGLVAEQFEI